MWLPDWSLLATFKSLNFAAAGEKKNGRKGFELVFRMLRKWLPWAR